MKIDLRYKPTGTELTISTPHNDPDQSIKLDFRAKNKEEQSVVDALKDNTFKQEVSRARGHYGHAIALDSTTNLDLAEAVYSLPSFDVIAIEPKVVARPLPEGAQS